MRSPLRFALALAMLLLAPSLVEAQSYAIDKGSLMIGGSAGFSSTGSDVDDDRYSYLLINPSVQYFVTRGLAFGGDIIVQHASVGDNGSTSYGVGPTATYFFGSSERPVYPYLSGSAQLVRNEGSRTLGFGASAGAIVMLVDAAGIDASLYYQQSETDDFSSDTYGLALGIAAFIF